MSNDSLAAAVPLCIHGKSVRLCVRVHACKHGTPLRNCAECRAVGADEHYAIIAGRYALTAGKPSAVTVPEKPRGKRAARRADASTSPAAPPAVETVAAASPADVVPAPPVVETVAAGSETVRADVAPPASGKRPSKRAARLSTVLDLIARAADA